MIFFTNNKDADKWNKYTLEKIDNIILLAEHMLSVHCQLKTEENLEEEKVEKEDEPFAGL